MLVKHNLTGSNVSDVLYYTSQAQFYNIERRGNTISYKGVRRPNSVYILGYDYRNYKDNYTKMIIKNTGVNTIIIEGVYKNNVRQSDITLLPGEYTEISRKNVGDGSCTWVRILNIDDYNKSHEITIINFMITKDSFSDVYLPNINTLPEDKQPLLPPEGDYKEIQPQ